MNYHSVPVRHGMTIGELAKLYNTERNINANLTVVPMKGWMRGDWFDSTAQLWVNPSPNLRDLNQVTLYPAVALIEQTNVSVGRGTDTPFEVIGAPWASAKMMAAYLNQRNIAGVRFVPTTFTPTSGPYARRECEGVNIIVTNREVLDAPELGLELAAALHGAARQRLRHGPHESVAGQPGGVHRVAGRARSAAHRRRLARWGGAVHADQEEVLDLLSSSGEFQPTKPGS